MSEEAKKSNSDDVSPASMPVLSCLRSRTDGIRKNNNAKVSFPEDENQLITGYLEPPNPWEYAENVSRDDLIAAYQVSCRKHGIEPLPVVLEQLQTLDIEEARSECLSLKGESLAATHCESLEEVLKRIQFKNIDLEATALDDEGSVALFDMVEYYESATHLNISGNKGIGIRGWQACSRMIKKTHCLEELNARNVLLNEPFMPILSRALKISTQLQVLKLENASLSGRSMVILVGALKLNTGLKELYLADNGLNVSDAAQLGALLRSNCTLQLLDISNNCIQDAGANHILDGLVQQAELGSGGLGILIVWNNHLSRNASNALARALARSKTLEMLNIGRNCLTNECLHAIKSSLQQNRTLLRIGMQSTHISCEGAVALAECIANNPIIQRIDLRDNNVQVAGLMALALSMKVNRSVSQLDLDDPPKRKLENEEALKQYQNLVLEIRDYCCRNELTAITEEKDVVEENETTPERRVRLPSAASRKISLTCETLMRAMSAPQDVEHPHLLTEPRRSGGRLRSPAPSPVPSPASSPIPSPSRNRFQVSRVSETSPASSPSPSSSSPSLSPSPSRFFASPGMSRFRVTLVEPSASNTSAPKPIISSPSGNNVTVGFSFKLNDKEITINTSVAGSCGIVTSSNSVISDNEPKLVNNVSCKSPAADMPQDTADLEVMQLMDRPVWEQDVPPPILHEPELVGSSITSPKPLHPITPSVPSSQSPSALVSIPVLSKTPSPQMDKCDSNATSLPQSDKLDSNKTQSLQSDKLDSNKTSLQTEKLDSNIAPSPELDKLDSNNTPSPQLGKLDSIKTPSSLSNKVDSNNTPAPQSDKLDSDKTPSPQSDKLNLNKTPSPQSVNLDSNIIPRPQSDKLDSNKTASPHSDQCVLSTMPLLQSIRPVSNETLSHESDRSFSTSRTQSVPSDGFVSSTSVSHESHRCVSTSTTPSLPSDRPVISTTLALEPGRSMSGQSHRFMISTPPSLQSDRPAVCATPSLHLDKPVADRSSLLQSDSAIFCTRALPDFDTPVLSTPPLQSVTVMTCTTPLLQLENPVINTTSLLQSDSAIFCTRTLSHLGTPVSSTPPLQSVTVMTCTTPLLQLEKPVINTTPLLQSDSLECTSTYSHLDKSVLCTTPPSQLERPMSGTPVICPTPLSQSDWPILGTKRSPQTDQPVLTNTAAPCPKLDASMSYCNKTQSDKESSGIISAQPSLSVPKEGENKVRTRKISWVAPMEPHCSEHKPASSLEKLLGLFQHPSSFFSKTQPQYKATSAIVNQQPVANSSASFLLTAGPLAGAVKQAQFLQEEDDGLSSPDGEPETDFLNNNGRDREQTARNSSKSCARYSLEEKEPVRTTDDVDQRLWCGSVCVGGAREPSPSEDVKEGAARSYASVMKTSAPANGMNVPLISGSGSALPVTTVRLVGGASSDPRTREFLDPNPTAEE